MTVTEASTFFKNIPTIKRKLDILLKVGLGYIRLGQSALFSLRRRITKNKALKRTLKASA